LSKFLLWPIGLRLVEPTLRREIGPYIDYPFWKCHHSHYHEVINCLKIVYTL
jgi:hypothetical protein